MTRTTTAAVGRPLALPLACALALAAGCQIPDEPFVPTPDPGDPGSEVLAIVPSVTALAIDENGNKQFSVTLSQAPAMPMSVKIEATSPKLGLSVPQLDFTPTNFEQAQTVTVTALADLDVADEVASITLSAAGVEPVTLSATVHDKDTLALVTDVAASNVVTLDEGQSVDVHVHLSNQPGGDVSVMAILGTGPVTVTPSTLVFTPANYAMEQTLRFTAAIDPNITTDDQPLTLRMGSADKLYTVRSVDKDVLNIAVTPSSLTVTEQGAAGNLNVALTQQPPADVTIAVTTLSGHIVTSKSQLTFTPQNYATNQTVQVTAPDDPDVEDDTDRITLSTTTAGVMAREVAVTIKDNDSQQILEDVPGTLAVTENRDVTFGVTLKFKPSTTVNVSVASLATGVATVTPGVLTFDATNYNVPKLVTVHGADDNNLAVNSTTIRLAEATIGMTDVPVDVADDDQQRIVVSATMIAVPEGTNGGFDVSLAYDPGTTVTATVASDNGMVVPFSPTSLTFTTTDYAQPHHVTVNPPVDTNNTSEMATLTISGAGAATPVTVNASVTDATKLDTWGWPAPFPSTVLINAGLVVAYKIDVGAVANVSTFHTYVPTAAGQFRMALYTNAAEVPGALVAEMPAGKTLVNGLNDGPILNGPQLTDATYFLVIRFSQNVNVGYAPSGTTGRQCIRNFQIPGITDPWPSSFGAAACTTDRLVNMAVTTYHQ
jgi:hypothetical protein